MCHGERCVKYYQVTRVSSPTKIWCANTILFVFILEGGGSYLIKGQLTLKVESTYLRI